MVKEMRELAERYRSVITTARCCQRAEFLKMIALSMLMESRFRPSQNASNWQGRRGCE